MNESEHLLTCLAEEASEVVKDVTKSLRFGLDDRNVLNPTGPTNRDRLLDELNDFIAVVEMLCRAGIIRADWIIREKVDAKKEKVSKFMDYAKGLGTLLVFMLLTLTTRAAEITIQKEWPAMIYTNQMIDRSVITNAIIITNTVYVLIPPASTNMGSRRPFIVTCPNPVCYEANQRLFPIKTKLGTSKRFLHATMHTLELTFVCPKCGKQFKTVSEKLIQDPVEEPADNIRTNMPPPPPPVVPKIRAPKS